MELSDAGYVKYDGAVKPRVYLVKWATSSSSYIHVGKIHFPASYAGKRFKLKVELCDE